MNENNNLDNNIEEQNSSPVSTLNNKILISGLGIFILGVLFFVSIIPDNFNIFKKSKTTIPVTNEDFKKAREVFTINPSMSKDLLENALTEVGTDSEEEGYIKLYLGTILLSDDKNQGIALLKQVSLNEKYLPMTRSSAINNLALFYDANRDEITANQIFSGPVWDGFYDRSLKEKHVALFNAGLKALEWSFEIHPNYLAYYRAASMYGLILYVSDSKERKSLYADTITRYIEKGDAELKETLNVRNDPENYVSQVVNGLLYKAAALEQLYLYTKNGGILPIISSTYADAGDLLEKNKDVYQARVLWGKYYYNFSAFLSRQVKPLPSDQIASMLNKISATSGDPIVGELKNAKNQDKNSFFKVEVASLAKIDPAFKSFLQSLGWENKDFAL